METGQTDKVQSLSHSAIGYHDSLNWLLPGVTIKLYSFKFRS